MEYIAHVREKDKEKQPLLDHLFQVSAFAEEFASKIGLQQAGKILGILHDMGKFSQEFQDYLASGTGILDPDADNYVNAQNLKGKIDHSSAGAQYIWEKFHKIGKAGQGRLCGQILSLCIASHHSGMINVLNEEGINIFSKRMSKEDKRTHSTECSQIIVEKMNNLDLALRSYTDKNSVRIITEKLREMVSFCPTIPYGISQVDAFTLGLITRFLLSCLVDADRLDSAEFEQPWLKKEREQRATWLSWPIAIERLEKKLASFDKEHEEINKIRHRISKECLTRATNDQGIYTLSVPTGGGKTLLTLRYALQHAQHHNLDRIIYIVPFTTIIEQNAEQVRAILEKEKDSYPWVLEHHSNIEPERQTWLSKLTVENWDAPIIFTTMVQFLETLFNGSNSKARRMHQLAKSVLIFDEIQSLPIKCTHMFCNALNFLTKHGGSTAILCTATQPTLDKLSERIPDEKRKKEVKERGELYLSGKNELVFDKENLFKSLKRVTIKNLCEPKGWEENDIAQLALEKISGPGNFSNCLIIVNTKAWARRLYKICSKQAPTGTVFHLSTNQCPAHRKKILESIKNKLERGESEQKEPVLCISTQLIEAGVDIDFSTVIRFLAGLDSIAQAAGRCNRHGKLKDSKGNPLLGEVYIVNPRDENTTRLEDIEEGKKQAQRIFDEFKEEDLLYPEAIATYFTYYFYNRSNEMVFPYKNSQEKPKDSLFNLLTQNNLNGGNVIPHEEGHSDKNPEKIPLLRQSFQDAGEKFRAIEAPTRSLIVPYEKGKKIIAELCALEEQFDIQRYYFLLKRAQQYSVNVFSHTWKKLEEAKAIYRIKEGEDVFYLEETFYSPNFGLSEEQDHLMEFLGS